MREILYVSFVVVDCHMYSGKRVIMALCATLRVMNRESEKLTMIGHEWKSKLLRYGSLNFQGTC